MLSGEPPFWPENDNVLNMIKQIESGTYELDPPKWDAITSDSKDFIRQCLTVRFPQIFNPMQIFTQESTNLGTI